MATEVYTTEDIVLLDGTEVELRPLPISKLRKFTRLWTEHLAAMGKKIEEARDTEDGEDVFNNADLTDAQYDVFIKLCTFGLESQLKGEKTDKQFTAYLEDVLDEKTIYRILDRTGSLKLGDEAPNQMNPDNLPGAAGTV